MNNMFYFYSVLEEAVILFPKAIQKYSRFFADKLKRAVKSRHKLVSPAKKKSRHISYKLKLIFCRLIGVIIYLIKGVFVSQPPLPD